MDAEIPPVRNYAESEGPGVATGRPGVPRWVKTLAVVMAALLLLALVVTVLSGGQHGPGRHRSSSLSPAAALAAGLFIASAPL
jgi:hypothetical protein